MRRVFRATEHQGQLEEQGYICAPFLGPEDIDRLLQLYQRAGPSASGGFHATLMSDDVAYRQTIHEAVLATFATRASELFEDYRLSVGNFFVKPKGPAPSEVNLHQDWSFVDGSRFRELTIWCPLIDVDPSNGCLRVVPGSHRFRDDVVANNEAGSYFSPFTGIAGTLKEKYLLDIPMKAGTAIIYDSRLLHASGGCGLQRDRVVAAAVAIPREAQMLHYFIVSPTEHEVFEVGDDFYWRDVRLRSRPVNAKSLGRVPFSRTPFTVEDLAKHLNNDSAFASLSSLRAYPE